MKRLNLSLVGAAVVAAVVITLTGCATLDRAYNKQVPKKGHFLTTSSKRARSLPALASMIADRDGPFPPVTASIT